ncbi:MAG TPA: hypothetical protein EYO76_00510 [Flavobacteriaceae bacterium]|nr:hypothetical protein [Flavobacteriaceae bacterium]
MIDLSEQKSILDSITTLNQHFPYQVDFSKHSLLHWLNDDNTGPDTDFPYKVESTDDHAIQSNKTIEQPLKLHPPLIHIPSPDSSSVVTIKNNPNYRKMRDINNEASRRYRKRRKDIIQEYHQHKKQKKDFEIQNITLKKENEQLKSMIRVNAPGLEFYQTLPLNSNLSSNSDPNINSSIS